AAAASGPAPSRAHTAREAAEVRFIPPILPRIQSFPDFSGDPSIAVPSDRLSVVMNPTYMVLLVLGARNAVPVPDLPGREGVAETATRRIAEDHGRVLRLHRFDQEERKPRRRQRAATDAYRDDGSRAPGQG